MWRLTKNNKLETVIPLTEGFYVEKFSYAQDKTGNMYWVRHRGDKTSFMKTTQNGVTTKIIDGNFERVQWIDVLNDKIYYVHYDNIYSLDQKGNIHTIVQKMNGKGDAHNSLYNLWSDKAGNIYVANATKRCIQRIDNSGKITVIYQSSGIWFPTGGVFDKNEKLHVLEWSDKNEIRTVRTKIT